MKPITKLFTKTMLLAMMAISVNFLYAGSVNDSLKEETRKNSIEFVKAEGDTLIFKIDLQNLPADGCTLIIRDEQGNIFFSENIKTMNHEKLYRINKDNMTGLNFEARNKKFLFKESFNFKTLVKETLLVTKS